MRFCDLTVRTDSGGPITTQPPTRVLSIGPHPDLEGRDAVINRYNLKRGHARTCGNYNNKVLLAPPHGGEVVQPYHHWATVFPERVAKGYSKFLRHK
jgi:hypothetical protein